MRWLSIHRPQTCLPQPLFFQRGLRYTSAMQAEPYFYSVGKGPKDPARQTEIKIKRSRFIASLAYADSMEAAKAFISAVSQEHKQATHNCWAYIVGEKGEIFHSSDAGEPAGTAGKPMLNILQANQMTCVAAVVTRYYGGVKLGVRGLIEAYGQAVDQAVQIAPLVRLVHTREFRVRIPYPGNELFLSRAGAMGARVLASRYEDEVIHELSVERDFSQDFEQYLEEGAAQGAFSFTWADDS